MDPEINQLRKNQYYIFGKERFGPFLYHYSEWLLQEIMKDHMDKVFFLARDGFMMKKGFEKICIKKGVQIDNEYVYFSRKSIRTALLWKTENYIESLKYMSVSRYVSIENILEYYGYTPDQFESIAGKYNLELSKDILFSRLNSIEQIKAFYLAERDFIVKNSKEQYDRIIQYLHQISFEGNVAIVDIGWHGSMQFYLEELARCGDIDVKIRGFYVGIDALPDISGSTEGYIFSDENGRYRKSTLCFFAIWERLFQCQEGSTAGYTQGETSVLPLQDVYEYENDKEICMAIKNIQQGSLAVFDDISKMCSAEKANKKIMRFGKYPTLREVQLFAKFYNTDGKKIYYLPQKGIFRYGLKEFIHDFSNSSWKTGFMKQAFKIPFPYYWIYALLRR